VQIEEVTAEVEGLKQAVVDGRRLNDLQIEDTNRLKMELSGLKKENEM